MILYADMFIILNLASFSECKA